MGELKPRTATDGRTIIVLLGGVDKRRQAADIAAAVARWKRYKQNRKDDGTDTRV